MQTAKEIDAGEQETRARVTIEVRSSSSERIVGA
jgi:hypothetical protein